MRSKSEKVDPGYELEIDGETFVTTREIAIFNEMDRYHLVEHPHIFRSAEGPYHALLSLMELLFQAEKLPESYTDIPTEFVEGLFQLKQ
ncbi:MAG: hypothetical protein ACKUBY_00055 [Candidatus Moraniibacteriota bacterium]|jgi:hypothetical protein